MAPFQATADSTLKGGNLIDLGLARKILGTLIPDHTISYQYTDPELYT